MFEYIRRNAGSTVVWLIVISIALVFIFWGVGSSGGVGSSEAFTLNGQKVSLQEYEQVMRNLQLDYKQKGIAVDDTSLPFMKQQALRVLINRAIVKDNAKKWGLRVSDSKLQKVILMDEAFQLNEKFDLETYKNRIYPLSPEVFETRLKDDVLSLEWSSLLGNLTNLSQADILERIHLSEDKVVLKYLFLPFRDYKDEIKYTETQLTEFYAKHKEIFRNPEVVKVDYIKIPFNTFLDEITVTDADIENQFNIYKRKFAEEEKGLIFSHILFNYPVVNPSAEERSQTLARAEEAYKRLEKEDFEVLVKELSDDTSTTDGDLGLYKYEDYPHAFQEAMKDLKVGDYSKPVATIYGYHILKVTADTTNDKAVLEDVKDELIADVKKGKSKYQAREAVYEALEFLDRSPAMDKAATMAKVELQTTAYFTEYDIPSFLLDEKLNLFDMKNKEVYNSSVETEDAFYLVSINDKKESFIPESKDIKAEIETSYIDFYSRKNVLTEMEKITDKLEVEGVENWDKIVEPYNKSEAYVGSFAAMKRFAYKDEPKIANLDEMEAVYAFLNLAGKNSYTQNPVLNRGPSSGEAGYFIFLVDDLIEVSEEDIISFTSFLQRSLKSQKTAYLHDEWFNASYKDANFKLNKNLNIN